MTVYHFCCAKEMRGIRSQGITKGQIVLAQYVWSGKKLPTQMLVFAPGWQWVTLDGSKGGQSWATTYTIRLDRTEYRWTVEIPEGEAEQLYDRERLKELYPESDNLFRGWPGSENWRVFRGSIPKYWLKKLEHWNRELRRWDTVDI